MSIACERRGLYVILLTKLRYLNLDFFFTIMGFAMFHFLRGKHSRPLKVSIAKKSSRQNIKMLSKKNFTNVMGFELQEHRAWVRWAWF